MRTTKKQLPIHLSFFEANVVGVLLPESISSQKVFALLQFFNNKHIFPVFYYSDQELATALERKDVSWAALYGRSLYNQFAQNYPEFIDRLILITDTI